MSNDFNLMTIFALIKIPSIFYIKSDNALRKLVAEDKYFGEWPFKRLLILIQIGSQDYRADNI